MGRPRCAGSMDLNTVFSVENSEMLKITNLLSKCTAATSRSGVPMSLMDRYRRTGVTVAVRSVAATYDNCIIVPEPSCARPSDIQVIL